MLALLETQRCRCSTSDIWLRGRDADVRFGMYVMSLDAIDPLKGHVPGNVRWVCSFLNPIDHSKDKRYKADDDAAYPSSWTRELFMDYVSVEGVEGRHLWLVQ